MPSQLEKCQRLADLHDGSDAFIIPNPWDAGSAKLLQSLGFQALATTSSGFAFTLAERDGLPSLDAKLQHCESLVSVTDVPISVDFENGFAEDLEGLVNNVERLLEIGVAGFSIEDFSRDRKSLYEADHAVERIQAAAEVIAGSGLPVQLTARAENLLRGVDDLDDTIGRLQAYAAAGADVLYAPGIRSLDVLSLVTAELDRPFNVLVSLLPDATVAELAAHGAKRISLGGALTWASLKPILAASREMLDQGTFSFVDGARIGAEVQELL